MPTGLAPSTAHVDDGSGARWFQFIDFVVLTLIGFAQRALEDTRGVGDRPAELEDFQAIRPEVAGTRGAVVSGHPLASAAGYEVLRAGGNATDAVVTMAAVLAVVRPHMNSVGGDAFALFHPPGAARWRP